MCNLVQKDVQIKSVMLSKRLFGFFFCFIAFVVPLRAEKLPHLGEWDHSILYLTWLHDPTTTMTVHWHTDSTQSANWVLYRKSGEKTWHAKNGFYSLIPKSNIRVHTLELVDLEPGCDYEFCVGKTPQEIPKKSYLFHTMPQELARPLSFVVGGDAYQSATLFRKMNHQIAAQDPAFVVLGGDIAYTQGYKTLLRSKGWQLHRWRTFLRAWKKQMISPSGKMIPILPVVGNHDVRPFTLFPSADRDLFYEIFPLLENRSFRAFGIGDYLQLLLLDTDHSYHITGEQSLWLQKQLEEREHYLYSMAAYHVAAYPSVYPYSGGTPRRIREFWCPLFEQYHLTTAFEHHNHAYKRTHLMKGVLYMGDGSWGVRPRSVKNKGASYLALAKNTNAVCLVTLEKQTGKIEALAIDGKIIDSATIGPAKSEKSER